MDYLTSANQDLAAAVAHEEELQGKVKALKEKMAQAAKVTETQKEIKDIEQKVSLIHAWLFLQFLPSPPPPLCCSYSSSIHLLFLSPSLPLSLSFSLFGLSLPISPIYLYFFLPFFSPAPSLHALADCKTHGRSREYCRSPGAAIRGTSVAGGSGCCHD